MQESGANFVRHDPCEECGSSDAKAVYDDGSSYCFSCESLEKKGGIKSKTTKKPKDLIPSGEYQDLPKRKITEETCRKYGYTVGKYNGKSVQIAPYYSPDGDLIAQKIRFANKEFTTKGDMNQAGLFGQKLWKYGGQRIVITEGEIDALSVSQAMSNKWPVVSVPNGAQSAKKAIAKNIEFLESYNKVVLMFDMDDPGRKAAYQCAELLSPGKAYIAELPLKDPNDMVLAGREKELVSCMFEAQQYRPDGIIDGADISLSELTSPIDRGYVTPYPILNEKMGGGIRKGELTLFCAGTGVGKSTIFREIGWHFNKNLGLTTGNVYLEENVKKTAQGFIAIDNNVPLGSLRGNPKIISEEAYRSSYESLIANGRTHFYNHFGSLESSNLMSKLRFFAVGLNTDFVFLDHISIVISGQESSEHGERKDIDVLMTNLRSLIENTGVGVMAIVHLRKSSGDKSHEEGGRVSLDDLRGSGSLKQLSDNIIALERNQQGDKPNISKIRVLKNREFGDLGLADTLIYSKETGRLTSTEDDVFDEEANNDDF